MFLCVSALVCLAVCQCSAAHMAWEASFVCEVLQQANTGQNGCLLPDGNVDFIKATAGVRPIYYLSYVVLFNFPLQTFLRCIGNSGFGEKIDLFSVYQHCV